MAERDNRSAQVHLRLTADEAARMRARAEASGLSLSAYIRRSALDGAPPPAPAAGAGELRALYTELRRIGNNLNQIARAMNANGLDGAAPAAVRASLSELDRATGAVASALAKARGL